MQRSDLAPFVLTSCADGATFRAADRMLRIQFLHAEIARITFTAHEAFQQQPSRIVTAPRHSIHFELTEDATSFHLATSHLRIELVKASGQLRYFLADGTLLRQEPEGGGKFLTAREVSRNVYDFTTEVETGQSIDGARATAAAHIAVHDRTAYQARLDFHFAPDEALFGLGSHEEGFGNLRGHARELYQQNMKAVVPHLVSTRGYSVLLDCGSLMTFRDDALGSYWWADCVDELDFYVIAGGSYAGILRGYRRLTGTVPLLPRWALGFVQSKERYVTAAELVDVVTEHRRRQIPLDVIVLDWKSWPNGGGWGQKSFDPVRFPDPEAMTAQLHALGAKLMVSIWPIMTGNCPNQRELLDAGGMLGNKSTYNAFDADARALYWQQADRGLFAHGTDAWWCDCTEPFESDWSGAVKPEPHERLALNTGESKRYLDPAAINSYSLAHSQGIYEGQRSTTQDKRVLNLTRSAYAGQSRYGTVTWNGDICATWQTLQRSIAEGLNFCATGEPYWTVDAGGFFLANNPALWFWRGDYNGGTRGLTAMDALAPDPLDTGCTDLGFWELYTRWLQYAAHLPMCRSHGTDAARESWRFGDAGSLFYDSIAATIRWRSRLVPYLYALAAAVSFHNGWMLATLALCFPHCTRSAGIADQYMLGPALMVCPITQPMFYAQHSTPLTGVPHTRKVFLPAGITWYSLHTHACHAGGQTIVESAPLDRIPLFAPAGSMLLLGAVEQFSGELPGAPLELRIFTGADATATLYEDDGNTYRYEQGECARVHFAWHDATHTLSIAPRQGSFPQLVAERDIDIVVYRSGAQQHARVRYTGAALARSLAPQENV